MVVWNVHCDWYEANDVTIGIFTNLALAAREAMKFAENALQWDEVLADIHVKPWGFYIDVVEKNGDWWGIETDFTGKIVFERITVNDLS